MVVDSGNVTDVVPGVAQVTKRGWEKETWRDKRGREESRRDMVAGRKRNAWERRVYS